MLAAALRDGTAHRRTSFELFARRLPEGRRYGVVAGTARFVEALAQFRFDDTALASLSDFLRPRDAGVPRRLPVPWGRRRVRRRRAVFPRLAGVVRARHLRRMRGAGNAGAVDLQPRHGDRVGRRADGQRSRRPPADRDGFASHPRASRRSRRTRRLHRWIHRIVQPRSAAHATGCLRWAPVRMRSRCCIRRQAGLVMSLSGEEHRNGRRRRSRHRSTRSASVRRCWSTPTTSPRAWRTPWRWPGPNSARSVSTPVTWACSRDRCATNSTAWARPEPASWCPEISTSSRSPRCAPSPSTSTAWAPRWSPARAPQPLQWCTSWWRWTGYRWRNAAATRSPTAAANRRCALAKSTGTIVEEVVHPFGRHPSGSSNKIARPLTDHAGARR